MERPEGAAVVEGRGAATTEPSRVVKETPVVLTNLDSDDALNAILSESLAQMPAFAGK
jgi:hypothetical protein